MANYLPVKIIAEDGCTPKYETSGSAGADLKANISSPITIKPMEHVCIPAGIKVAIPDGYEMQIRPRSGLAVKKGISVLNSPGTIDSDFRGEVGVILINLSDKDFEVKPLDRIAQAVIVPVYQAVFTSVESLTRPRPKEIQIDGWTRKPSNLFSPFKKLTSEACLLFVKK